MTVTDEYLQNNAVYAEQFTGALPLPPSRHVAVLACMDARVDVYRVLGITEIILIHHTDCGFVFDVATGKLNEVLSV